MHNGLANRRAILDDEPVHDRVLPLFRALAEQERGHHWRDDDGETECAQQRKTHRPCHRLEQPPLDRLQRENWQVRSDDDAARIKHWPQHLVCRIANLLPGGARVVL